MRRLGLSRDVQQVHAHEDDQEPADQREGIGGIGSVEALEEDGRGNDGGGGKEDVVYRIDPFDQLCATWRVVSCLELP